MAYMMDGLYFWYRVHGHWKSGACDVVLQVFGVYVEVNKALPFTLRLKLWAPVMGS